MTQRFLDAAKYVMNQINSANLSGAIDVIVVEQEDGSLVCSPFHVRFGKLGTLVAAGRPVDVLINGQPVPSLRMKLGRAGEAFFVEERILEEGETVPCDDASGLLTTPITSDLEDETREETRRMRCVRRTQSLSEAGEAPRLRRAVGVVDDVKSEGEEEEEELALLLSCKSDSMLNTPPSKQEAADAHQDSLTWEWGELPVEALGPDEAALRDRRASLDGRVTFTLGNSFELEDGGSDVEVVHGEGGGERMRKRKRRRKRSVTTIASDKEDSARCEGIIEEEMKSEVPKDEAEEEPREEKKMAASEEEEPETKAKEDDDAKGKEEENSVMKGKEEEKPKTEGKEEEKPKAEGGIYLSELIDRPELRDLYVYGRSSDGFATPGSRDGAVSPIDLGYRSDGEGSVSPVPVSAGAMTATGGAQDDAYRIRNIQLSLCGGLEPEAELTGGQRAGTTGNETVEGSSEAEGVDEERFRAHMVLYEEFCRDPDGILTDPNLVVLLNGRYYNWAVAAPLLVSSLVYQCELPPKAVDRMIQKHMVKKEVKRRGSMFSRWTSWGRRPASSAKGVEKESKTLSDNGAAVATAKTEESANPPETAATGAASAASTSPSSAAAAAAATRVFHVKSLRLPSERLRQLGLKSGANTIEYRVVSQFQGTARCHAQIYLWHWTDRLVISDIDGTITQSDVMGQLGPFLGRDVSQRGVAGLYSRIAANRFRLLYLSSRAIGQAHWTRSYLESVVQERGARLPQGPLLLSPTSLLFALVREIRNRPEDFKIPCLRDVRSLFPAARQPFFAGFGNKINDVRAYEAVGVPPGRIFVVNPEGDLRRHGLHHYRTNYASLGDLVDHFFPEKGSCSCAGLSEHEEFSHFTFWRDPPPELAPPENEDEKTA